MNTADPAEAPRSNGALGNILLAVGGTALAVGAALAFPFFIVPWLPRAKFGALPYLNTSPRRIHAVLSAVKQLPVCACGRGAACTSPGALTTPSLVGHGRSFLDLGSGDGIAVRVAAAAPGSRRAPAGRQLITTPASASTTGAGGYGMRGVGVELNPSLVLISRLLALRDGVSSPATTFIHANMFDVPIHSPQNSDSSSGKQRYAPVGPFDVIMVFGVVPLMPRIAAKLAAEALPHAVVVSHKFPLPTGPLPLPGSTEPHPGFTEIACIDDMRIYRRAGPCTAGL